jgi:hypothetical protein
MVKAHGAEVVICDTVEPESLPLKIQLTPNNWC